MALEWSENLSTGIDWQDRQHKELFSRIDSLLNAMEVGKGKEEVGRLFDFLDEYFVVHFDAEGRAMEKYGYPGAASHLAEHAAFMDDISKLKQEYGTRGASTGLVIKAQRRVVDWLIRHIGEVDKAMSAFIKKAESGKING